MPDEAPLDLVLAVLVLLVPALLLPGADFVLSELATLLPLSVVSSDVTEVLESVAETAFELSFAPLSPGPWQAAMLKRTHAEIRIIEIVLLIFMIFLSLFWIYFFD
jgi:hypothetical protein